MTIKTFFLKLSVLLFSVAIVDIGIGIVLDKIFFSPNNKLSHIYKYSDEDVLIFGSSRALCHYDPSIINDSLNAKGFNFGVGNRYIKHNYALFRMATDRYSPKVIIFDIFQDQLRVWGNSSIVNDDLLPLYYKNTVVERLLNEDDKMNKFKTISSLYRYNSKFGSLVNDVFLNSGYVPQYNLAMPDSTELTVYKTYNGALSDSVSLSLIDDIIRICNRKDIELFFVASPMYYTINDDDLIYDFEDYIKDKDAVFLNYLNYDKVMDPKYFYDASHLNYEGSQIFTSTVISDIKKHLNNKGDI